MGWGVKITTTFEKGVKKLKGNSWLKKRIYDRMKIICDATNPRALGDLKQVEGKEHYTYDVTDDCRILFDFDELNRTVVFHRVCSHKEVYR